VESLRAESLAAENYIPQGKKAMARKDLERIRQRTPATKESARSSQN